MRRTHRVVSIGEALFDVFPDGERLGGAPFNVAWHLRGLGWAPVLVSRVGTDVRGEQMRLVMRRHGMSLDGLQRDPTHPTGVVNVTLDDDSGGHQFEILPDQAYDYVDARVVATLTDAAPVDLWYFGTLATRRCDSLTTHLAAVHNGPGIRLLDVNLRPACWNEATVTACLAAATVAKVNDDELAVLRDLYELPGDEAGAARALRARFDLDALILTRGGMAERGRSDGDRGASDGGRRHGWRRRRVCGGRLAGRVVSEHNPAAGHGVCRRDLRHPRRLSGRPPLLRQVQGPLGLG